MARPPLVLGTWGSITRTKRDTGWVASAHFRDFDGVARKVERRGATGRQAEDALVEHLRERTRAHGGDITGDTKVRTLSEQWYEALAQQGKAQGTLDTYSRALRVNVLAALGNLRLREATVPVIDRYVGALIKRAGTGQAKTARVVLNGMFSLAVRHGAVATNPVRETEPVWIARKEVREVQTIGVAEVVALRERLATWDAGVDRAGNVRVTDLGPVIAMLLATGVRTGEVLALPCSDLDLNEAHPTVGISGTLVQSTGQGLMRQEKTKTASSQRRLQVPSFAATMLRARERTSVYVFPSSTGTLRSQSNLRRQWRDFRREHGYEEWITPKTFRKAVETLIRDDLDLDTAAAQLGHSSIAVTQMHYAARLAEGPDIMRVLERFAG